MMDHIINLAKENLPFQGLTTFSDATRIFDLKKGQISTWAKENGYLNKRGGEINEKGNRYFNKYIAFSKGKDNTIPHSNIGITQEGLMLIEKNLEEIRVSGSRYIKNIKEEQNKIEELKEVFREKNNKDLFMMCNKGTQLSFF